MRTVLILFSPAPPPQEFVNIAWELGLSAIGILKKDGLYSAVQVAEAAQLLADDSTAGIIAPRPPLRTVFGVDLTLSAAHLRKDSAALVLTIIVRNQESYRQLLPTHWQCPPASRR